MATRVVNTSPLPVGKTTPLLVVSTPETNTWEITFSLDADSVLLSLYVGSLSSGQLDVTAYAVADEGKEVSIIEFPTITGPTANLLLRKAAISLSRVRVLVTATGPATIDLRARGISSGETSVRIESATDLTTNQLTVGTSPTNILPAALTDRLGVVIRNWSGSTIYLGETALKATSVVGYPIGVGESIALDISAGQDVFAATGSGTSDVRVMQAGEA